MKTALVTGANKGIGFEVARQLAQNGFFVYLGSRSLESGSAAVEKLKAAGIGNVEAVQLDVTNQESVNAARATIGKKNRGIGCAGEQRRYFRRVSAIGT